MIEAKETIGGGMRSAALTLPGFVHDVCSAVHPLAAGSPFFCSLPLQKFGLEFIHSPIVAAHPFENGKAAALFHSLEQTAASLSNDSSFYLELMKPLVKNWSQVAEDILGPFHLPRHLFATSEFGFKALQSAKHFAKKFKTRDARGLWAGMAAHSMQPFSNTATAAFGLILLMAGHSHGWPIPRGGSESIANALSSYFISLGGTIQTNFQVQLLDNLPSSRAIVLDVSPKQLLQIAGEKFSFFYKWQLKRYRYGMGIFKIDWALDQPIPFTASECRQAATVHLGNSFEEIEQCEKSVSKGKHPEKPFVILAQPSLFDSSRAPENNHTAWAYCHVPNGSEFDMTERIENQVERFAPGFKQTIIGRHVMNCKQVEEYNPNYVGGDINGGIMNLSQLFTRPAFRLSPYRTSAKGIYLCSASTPPGGGVHGMCGFHAARRLLKDVFNKKVSLFETPEVSI